MIKLKEYEFEYDHESNALIVSTPEGKVFTMNCEGLDEKAIISSVKNCKFYPEHNLKNLLDRNIPYQDAYKQIKELDDAYQRMKKVIVAEV